MFDRERLFQLIESNRDLLVATLQDLIRFETVSGMTEPAALARFQSETRRCLDYLRAFAERHGFAWREHPAGVGVIEWGSGDEAIGFPSHCDVVPAGGQWHHPPFAAELEDDMICGRGAQDNKGPMACGLIALLALSRLAHPTRRKIRLLFGTREEGGDWTDISSYLADEPAPLYCIVPDATFPIINGEKGMATLRLRPPAGALPERKDGLRLETVRAGERANVVPDRALVQLSGPLERREMLAAELADELEAYRQSRPILLEGPLAVSENADTKRFLAALTFLGRSAHGSRPHEGHNAAVDALGYLVRLGLPPGSSMDFIGLNYCSGKDLLGAYLDLDHEHPFIGPTTTSLNIFQFDAAAAEAQINVRFPLGLTSAEILARVRRRVAEKIPQADRRPAIEYDGRVYESLFTDPARYPDLFAALREAYQLVTGREAGNESTGGTTYAKAFPRAVSFGPTDTAAGEPDMDHKADEFVTIPVIVRNAKIYAHVLAALCLA